MNFKFLLILIFISAKIYTQNINAKILETNIACVVNKQGHYIVEKTSVIQINNAEGLKYTRIKVPYSEKEKLKSLKARILDVNYNEVRKIKNREIKDYASYSKFFHTDNRFKELMMSHNDFPYLIEMKYVILVKEFISLPYWLPQANTDLNVEKSMYSLTVPKDYTFHHRLKNFKAKYKKNVSGENRIHIWESENIKRVEYDESLSFCESKYGEFTPDQFIYGNVKGKTTSWNAMGLWESKLNENLDVLPTNEKEKIKELVKGITSVEKKVERLYQYLQKENRYVGVFEGDGGFRSFSAEYVSKNKYGDCKALTTYMKAMLKAVGVSSYYALIKAGRKNIDIDPEYIGQGFNHVVLYVPLKSKTLWLECTSQYNPYNFWSTFTNGKFVLICDFENSFLTKSPVFNPFQNAMNTNAIVKVSKNDLRVSVDRLFLGEEFERIHKKIKNGKGVNKSSFSDQRIENDTVLFSKIKNKQVYQENSKLVFKDFVKSFGSNLVIMPFNFHNKFDYEIYLKRKKDLYIPHNYSVRDTIQYVLPKGYQINSVPDSLNIENQFGKVTASFLKKEDRLNLHMQVVLKKGLYEKESVLKLKKILDGIHQIERRKILFEKL